MLRNARSTSPRIDQFITNMNKISRNLSGLPLGRGSDMAD